LAWNYRPDRKTETAESCPTENLAYLIEPPHSHPIDNGTNPLTCTEGDKKRATEDRSSEPEALGDSWIGYGLLVTARQPRPGPRPDVDVPSELVRPSGITYHSFDSYPAFTRKPTREIVVPGLVPYATDEWLKRGPIRVVFPLSPDHRLITMIQYNCHRAGLMNMAILHLLDCLPDECNGSRAFIPLSLFPPQTVPPNLQPTQLQQSTPHPYWIKVIPFPKLRDNLIRLSGTYDSREFNYDMGKNLYEGFDSLEHRGWLVWGEPWSAFGWEASEGFIRKWGFLLEGCGELITVTNSWRESRGEDPLVVEV
jgi:hypothetical protein